MRVTKSQLRKVIRSVILENEMSNMQSGSIRMSIQPLEIYDIVKDNLRYSASTEILKQITSYGEEFETVSNEPEFMEFVEFCNEYYEKVYAGKGDWRSREPEMQAKATSLNISISDCISILVAYGYGT